MNFVTDDETLKERVRRLFSKRKDVLVYFSGEFSENADLNVVPVERIFDISHSNKIGHPVIAYGSPIFLRDAFIAGCADFIKEPWTLDELEARVEKLLGSISKRYEFPWGTIRFGDSEVTISGRKILLTYQEMRVLRTLVEQRGIVVPREALFYTIWGNAGNDASRVIDVHVASLRKKLHAVLDTSKEGKIIVSIRNAGYTIN